MSGSEAESNMGAPRRGTTGEGAFQALMMAPSPDVAAQLYEELGLSQRERLQKDAAQAAVEERQRLAEVLRQARDFSGAARLLDGCGAAALVAELYVQGGRYVDAAEAWLRAGEVERAAAAFERGGAMERALEVYRGLGAREAMAHCLVRLGRPYEAAQLYRELGQPHAEVEALGGVPSGDPRHLESVLRMCKLLDAEGFTRRALALLADTMRGSETARADPALATEKARLLRRMGMDAEAEAVIARLPSSASAPESNGYHYLKAIPIFGELSLDDMKDLYRVARQVLIPAGAVLLEKGTPGSGLFVMLEGAVDVFSGPEAEARRLNTLGPGAYLGEISLVQDAPVSAQVRARTAVRALRITRAGFQHYLDTHDAAALRIFRLFTHNLAARVRALST
ncbi:cAMP-binding protein [Myxococcus hansupus]|uniref:cAMP-binding protein n=1 Tax=Pseudomyxococcus hansupus TaxID=1297742 RepID=A0A0H4WQX4_9BACT|nr:cyclic nucleotide-binding domain-containing protein [Myxococcus hansupus]AKQ65901.1 cAMP-binding protein [Myxococcus hansupus]APZ78760.1 cyclic nucleotide-binding protein [Myxococcus hansupus]